MNFKTTTELIDFLHENGFQENIRVTPVEVIAKPTYINVKAICLKNILSHTDEFEIFKDMDFAFKRPEANRN